MARASEAASVAATQYLRRETSPKGGAAFAAEPEQSPGIEAGSVPRNVIDGVGDVVDPSGQAFTNERGPATHPMFNRCCLPKTDVSESPQLAMTKDRLRPVQQFRARCGGNTAL